MFAFVGSESKSWQAAYENSRVRCSIQSKTLFHSNSDFNHIESSSTYCLTIRAYTWTYWRDYCLTVSASCMDLRVVVVMKKLMKTPQRSESDESTNASLCKWEKNLDFHWKSGQLKFLQRNVKNKKGLLVFGIAPTIYVCTQKFRSEQLESITSCCNN